MLRYLAAVLPFVLVPVSASALTINPTWDPSLTSSPDAAKIQAAVGRAITYLEAHYSTPITLNVQFGWGTVATTYPVTSLGESYFYYNSGYTSAQVLNYLKATAQSTGDASAYAHFPTSAQVPTFFLNYAQQKLFGLRATSAEVDGYVGFGASYAYTFDSSSGVVAPGTFDLYGVALHEITEVMGRISDLSGTEGGVLDAFRCAGAAWSPGPGGGDFSVDGCASHLQSFNNNAGGDYGDWSGATNNDPVNAYSSDGIAMVFSEADLAVIDVLGYTRLDSTTIVNGACGAASGVLTAKPPVALCLSGVPTAVTSDGSTWSWSCGGVNGGTTQTCSAPVAVAAAPAAPTNLSATSHAKKTGNRVRYSVTLSWLQAGETSDTVMRSVNGGAFTAVTLFKTTSTVGSYVDPNVAPGTTYAYYVIASNASGDSPKSATVSPRTL